LLNRSRRLLFLGRHRFSRILCQASDYRRMDRTIHRAVEFFVRGHNRFLLPVLGFALAHVVIGFVLYLSLRLGVLKILFPNVYSARFDWLQLFSAWDSVLYRDIALNWYPPKLSPDWAFSPLYPATVRVLSLLGIDAGLGAFAVALICGFASIVVFQWIAERYMARSLAVVTATLYFLFPPVFVFSMATYSQSMFLLLALLAWHFHRQRSELKASIAGGLCALSRPEGFLIIIPLLYDYLRQKQFKKIGYVIVPLSATTGWELYGFAVTGVWLPTLAAERFWEVLPNVQIVRQAVLQLTSGNLSSASVLLVYWKPIAIIIAVLVLVFFLAWRDWKIDRALSIYLLGSVLILASASLPGLRSFPRILSFFFPVGIGLHTRGLILFFALTLTFLVLDCVAWLAFLTDGFY
jgi:hypothetical protein